MQSWYSGIIFLLMWFGTPFQGLVMIRLNMISFRYGGGFRGVELILLWPIMIQLDVIWLNLKEI